MALVDRLKLFPATLADVTHGLSGAWCFIPLASSKFRIVFDAVFFLGLFGVVPAVDCSDQIQDVIDGLFIPSSASRPAVQHIFSRVLPLRGAVSWRHYFGRYALPLTNHFIRLDNMIEPSVRVVSRRKVFR